MDQRQPYTPAEIYAAGLTEGRRANQDLYVELDRLRQEATYLYHVAFVDTHPGPDAPGRLAYYPAPAGFGGNELATAPRHVHLDRLTPRGLTVYIDGLRTGQAEREALAEQIDAARLDAERLTIVTTGTLSQKVRTVIKNIERGTTAHLVTGVLRHIDTLERRRRHKADTPPGRPLIAWFDVPVRLPGTTRYAVPAAAAGLSE